MKPITWKTVSVDVKKIKPTPNNFKLKTEEGLLRFRTSVKKFGLAGTVILNTDFTLIDGNTRWEKAKEQGLKKIDASVPSRKLTPKEFNEFSAMYDAARAGEVDVLRIKEELGTTASFFKDWGFELPKTALSKLAEMEKTEGVVNPTASREIKEESQAIETSRITLIFRPEESAEYLRLAESLYSKFKVDNITDLSLKALRYVKKNMKK